MAKYVMSDLHGNYEAYKKALTLINFQNTDTLYVLGDVIDRGSDSIKILMDMMMRDNVIPIIGNHEYMALLVLQFLMTEITEDSVDQMERNPEVIDSLQHWIAEGGESTISEFNELESYEKEMIIDYLDEFRLYETVCINDKDYVLVHAGLSNFSPERELDSYQSFEVLFDRADYDKIYYTDKILITGHTPTQFINDDGLNKIYKKNNHIAIDCGGAYGGNLAVLRLDDEKEFYTD